MQSLVIISTTFENKNDGEKVAQVLLKEKYVACAQVSGPITSYYRWHGSVTSSTEFTLTLKTTASLCGQVKARLKEIHPYELPEIIVQNAAESSSEYMDWVAGEVRE